MCIERKGFKLLKSVWPIATHATTLIPRKYIFNESLHFEVKEENCFNEVSEMHCYQFN